MKSASYRQAGNPPPETDRKTQFPYVRAGSAPATHETHRIAQRAATYRRRDAQFAEWAKGYGVIRHTDRTQVRIYELCDSPLVRKESGGRRAVMRRLVAADRIASAAMWLVAHMSYAYNVYPDGRKMSAADFKRDPQGHMGGSLNMAIAYVGYLAANALSGITRSWVMGQGHCVAAIDAANLIVGNLSPAHAGRYSLSRSGLNRFVRDFYSYKLLADGRPDSPLGSHVNVHTAGGMMEGGYLGFAELQYVHMPLPGERLVAFLSDGAFEEQRGADWAPRWWRAEDCGLVSPIMIANGRRIEQRSGIAQDGGLAWFREHLQLNGFDPIEIDGRDPADFAWAILQMEERLQACAEAVRTGRDSYPVALHYAVADVPKGYGFPGSGTNLAHNLPLGTNPALDGRARKRFNKGAQGLWVPFSALTRAVAALNNHESPKRPREKDHPAAARNVAFPRIPSMPWNRAASVSMASPMEAIDVCFSRIVQANPHLRVRVGNPDELRSNRMHKTLDLLKHRTAMPEMDVAENLHGAVITALNEEAVVSAALANKGGISIVVSYEAFAVKMLGAIRQEIIFARHQVEAGRGPRWLSMPLIVSSHTWENGKNEQSHQDPTICEALLAEMSDVSRVVFPADWNSAIAALTAVYGTHGQAWTLAVPKQPVAGLFDARRARKLVEEGAICVSDEEDVNVLLIAIGAYQLAEAMRASLRLREAGISNSVIYLFEPGKFRTPRDMHEARHMAPAALRAKLFPDTARARVILTHTRPDPVLGMLRALDSGENRMRALGYINRGGTLDTAGMLFANRCTWAHAIEAVAQEIRRDPRDLLDAPELKALRGDGDPAAILGKHRA